MLEKSSRLNEKSAAGNLKSNKVEQIMSINKIMQEKRKKTTGNNQELSPNGEQEDDEMIAPE